MQSGLSPCVRGLALPRAHSPRYLAALRGLRHSHALPCAYLRRLHVWFCRANHRGGLAVLSIWQNFVLAMSIVQ
eukprot:4045397-Pleurochrysis_carterae.AAC.1